jgi:parallel beta-helix repeat protein
MRNVLGGMAGEGRMTGEGGMAGESGLAADGGVATDGGAGIYGGAGGAAEAGAGATEGCDVIALKSEDIIVPTQHATIQAGLDAAKDGQTIVVEPGIYYENLNFSGKVIRLVSRKGPAETIIDGGEAGAVVTFHSGTSRKTLLAGFTIQNGFGPWGAGVELSFGDSPTIKQNVFVHNVLPGGGFGAAIGGNGASPLITRNLFAHNTCDSQFHAATVSLVNDGAPVIVENVFANNDCRGVSVAPTASMAVNVSNNTFVNNRSGIYIYDEGAQHVYRNNLIVGGDLGVEAPFEVDELPYWSHNLVFNNAVNYSGTPDMTNHAGNLSADPKLVDVEGLDVHLASNSPAIDAGEAALLPLSDWDMDGEARLQDGDGDHIRIVDIGADEFSTSSNCVWGNYP